MSFYPDSQDHQIVKVCPSNVLHFVASWEVFKFQVIIHWFLELFHYS